ncbi:MAG: type I-E CRISPR-associated protein Cas5/CasD [Chloroflexota bacterium]|nr:type I-E CRISPR-associated protein Cas5/CasD [Chloroflexota bacterium]
MSVLLLRLSGPMQSWGVQSRFTVRDTGLEPSKSGVVGLIAAAMGRPRHADIGDLAGLRMAVRVDREGILKQDYHTAQNVLRAKSGLKDTELSWRYYLADACFLVALQGPAALLESAQRALRNPRWAIFLGRRAFPPGEPVWLADGLQPQQEIAQAIRDYPWLTARRRDAATTARVIIEDPNGSEQRPDQPISFQPRRFTIRLVQTDYWRFPQLEGLGRSPQNQSAPDATELDETEE